MFKIIPGFCLKIPEPYHRMDQDHWDGLKNLHFKKIRVESLLISPIDN